MSMNENCNPISDIKRGIDFHEEHDRCITEIQIRKKQFDMMLQKTGCKNADDFLKEYRKRYPHSRHFKIVVLVDNY